MIDLVMLLLSRQADLEAAEGALMRQDLTLTPERVVFLIFLKRFLEILWEEDVVPVEVQLQDIAGQIVALI